MPIPTTVKHSDLMAALKPLCELLGTNPNNFFANPGLTVAESGITFTVPVRHGDGERVPAVVAGESDIPPHPHGLDVEPVVVGPDDTTAELGYEVRVTVDVWDEVK